MTEMWLKRNPVWAAALVGVLATIICFGWLVTKVHFLYQGNWTATFYHGARMPLPPELADEKIRVFPDVAGFDGQLYHIMAHDPLIHRGFDKYVDRLRYRRILVPALAALLSFGQQSWVDPAYIFVFLCSVYLGTYWFARWCLAHEMAAWKGFLFLLSPALITTLMFMLVDSTLAALTMALIWYAERENRVRLFIVLACAALTRETGIFLVGGYCLWLLIQKKLVPTIVFAASALPSIAWYWYVDLHTAQLPPRSWFSPIPFYGVYQGIVNHYVYREYQAILLAMDWVALTGMMLAFGITIYSLRKRENWSPAGFMAAALVVAGIFLSVEGVWPEVNSFGRYFSPLLLYIGVTGMMRGNWWWWAPTLLVDIRIGSIFLIETGRVLSAILHSRH